MAKTRETFKVTFEGDSLRRFEDLMKTTDGTSEEVMKAALQVYSWCVKQIDQGNTFGVLNKVGTFEEVPMFGDKG